MRFAIRFTNSFRLRRNRGLPSIFFKVDYLSSSGVALLVGLKRRVETRGGKIVLYRVQPIVRDLLAVMKLDKFFIIVDNEQQALASLPPVSTA